MSQGTEAEKLYAAIEETSRLVGASFSRDQVWPVLDAFRDALLTDGAIIFSAQINAGQVGELEYTVQVSPGAEGPYTRALAGGFLQPTDHPVGSLLTDLQTRVQIDDYFIDCDITNGFKKVYAQFPRSLQKVSQLADIPSMPRSVADNADLFARHGLEEVALVGINYQRPSVNLYFQLPAAVAGRLDPETIRSLLRDMGLPDPDERMLAYASKAYRVYATLTWDSPEIHRISFAPMPSPGLDLTALPARLDPELVEFLKTSPYTYAGERVNASAAKWSSAGEHLDLAVYHQIPPRLLQVFTANAAAA
ncbi:aromatic prenyltransferase [Streptomyces sp. DH24]|uniref:aromatic prenyltransferase n=1 Tax=Streptomyces sp. DH24 TaxID=3040123 RepID=UPI002441C431|nr:aromatic prenyltransferase [Streptomyces sp. DH24]MDG9720187.1 aromatic prenyltransferase [Streptomyces sp. DH24]